MSGEAQVDTEGIQKVQHKPTFNYQEHSEQQVKGP